MPTPLRHFTRLPYIVSRACFGVSLLALASAPALAEGPEAEQGRDPNFGGLKPIVRIVSPLADSTVMPGVSRVGRGNFDGTGFVVNVEVVTRDQIGIEVREATVAPPVFGIRHVSELNQGARNPDVPGLFVFFDQPLTTPDGQILRAFSNVAAAFNVAGSDDTPGKGITTWLGWHVLESLPEAAKNVTMTAAFVDRAGRVAFDQVKLNVADNGMSGQALTPAPETFLRTTSTVDDGQGPEVSLIAPRVPTAIAIGPQDASLTPNNGSLFFIQVSAVDRKAAGIAVSENGLTSEGKPLNAAVPTGLIFDPSAIPNRSPNRNFPGLTVSLDVPLRQPNGNLVPAGTNLAGLFDVAGSEVDASGSIRTTVDWVVGGALVVPTDKQSVTINASVTDNAGHTGTTKSIVTVSNVISGQDLTP